MLRFSKGHYFGMAILLFLIGIVQIFISQKNTAYKDQEVHLSKEELKWLTVQNEVDSLKIVNQKIASKIYPFNPNFISDYKGYKYGMTTQQIDRLHQFRKHNKYVNSKVEFQKLRKWGLCLF